MIAEVDALTATVADVVKEVTATNETLTAVVTEFGEIKARLDAAINANDARAIADAAQALGLALGTLKASRTALADAAAAVDPTPETPVPGATPPVPPPEVPPPEVPPPEVPPGEVPPGEVPPGETPV